MTETADMPAAEAPAAPITATKSLAQEVSSQISSSGYKVRGMVIDHMVAKELNRRSELLVEAITDADKQRKGLYKIKADNVAYNEDGSVASATWSKAALESKKKAEDKLAKLEKAIEKALVNSDYSDLTNVKSSD